MPGVVISPIRRGRSSATGNLITMRGPSGPCLPAILIDGVPVPQNDDSSVDGLLRPDVIEGVEVYTRSAGAPIEFVQTSTCGVVAFWTRSGARGEVQKWGWTRLAAGAGAVLLLILVTR